jgi:hypothetical protein
MRVDEAVLGLLPVERPGEETGTMSIAGITSQYRRRPSPMMNR